MKYDVIIVGAGPTGIFTALELLKTKQKLNILILEKGNKIENRTCPKRKTNKCVNCDPCNITNGFSGAGAFSDGKLTFSTDTGGQLKDYISKDELKKMSDYVDSIYLEYGADAKTYGTEYSEEISKIKAKAIKSNLRLIESKIRHIGTEKCSILYKKIQDKLTSLGINMLFNNPVKKLIIENKVIKGVVADKEYFADKVILSVGRDGADWLKTICDKNKISTKVGPVDIGIRVEVRNEIMHDINKYLYEGKFIYYTKTFDDKVRTFCQNPSGHVSTENYQDVITVNGHSYKDPSLKSKNTNFALLVSNYFTEPFNNPIKYGKYVAKLSNMLSGNKIIVQRYGDFKRGRRTTITRLDRNNIRPTLKDAVPGDLSLVIPYRIMLDLKEMIEALDNIFPGIDSDETLLYGVEVKFYSNILKLDNKFRTNIKGLYAGGDGAGVTRGLMQASINGVLIARSLFED